VQVCRACGGLPLGTAGSAAKRVRLRGAGLQCVHSSRSTSFVEGLLAAGGGGHPQAVLNSLTSPGVLCTRAHATTRQSACACSVRLAKRSVPCQCQAIGKSSNTMPACSVSPCAASCI